MREIGKINGQALGNTDVLFTILDDAELHSGAIGEKGFAAAQGQRC